MTIKINGFTTLSESEVSEELRLLDTPCEVSFYLQSDKSKMLIAFLTNGMFYTEAMRESVEGSLQDCIKLLEDETGEKQL